MHVLDPIGVPADDLGRIPATGSEVRGVRAEGDPASLHDDLEFVRILDDGVEVWVIAGLEAVFLSDLADGVQRASQPVIVLVGGTSGTTGASPDHQPLRPERRGQLRSPTHPVQLVRKDVGVDEVGARVHADEFQPRGLERVGEDARLPFELGDVPVEHLDAPVADLSDLPDSSEGVPVSQVEEVLNAGDPGGMTHHATPGD